ncbi:nucleoid-associated protein [Acinetobacter baumannii]|uniref:nucleoid-associated protein n=1 Tax=Acinetobacter baumannii TaxID=470 RepID=UPI001902BE43|nr:nucleoid-associated protein [Acinetobacter baumannii]MBJ9577488.1 nucleoid-associated protein [Acinetobacter baumannii]MCT9423642.1 nucleoid-associated protein [Acinetobacter baumannii]
MSLTNLSVDRVIIHQIFQKTSDKFTMPVKSLDYTNFAPDAMSDFEARVIQSLGADSKAVKMKILDQNNIQDLPYLINSCVDESNKDFIESSYQIAEKLARAQFDKSSAISGGIVVIFTGKQGSAKKRLLGIIKAELHSGYEKLKDPITGQISLKHIQELLLTPNSKLFKTVGFYENSSYDPASVDLNDKWTPLIFDSQISKADGKASAEYFYRKFAGCGYLESDAKTTKQFYDATRNFILKLDKPSEEKYELLNALTTYLKVDKSSAVDPIDFAETYFDIDTCDDFRNHLIENKIPTSSFIKDIEFIQSQLKLHKVTFNNSVKLEADPEIFRSDVIVTPIKGEKDENGNEPDWTQIIVKSQLILKK